MKHACQLASLGLVFLLSGCIAPTPPPLPTPPPTHRYRHQPYELPKQQAMP